MLYIISYEYYNDDGSLKSAQYLIIKLKLKLFIFKCSNEDLIMLKKFPWYQKEKN